MLETLYTGHAEIEVDFKLREHLTENNEFPTRTWPPEAWPKEFTDAVTKTHQQDAHIDWTVLGGHDMACSMFARTPMDYLEALRKKKVLEEHDHNTGGRLWRRLWSGRQDDTAPSTNIVTKFVHAGFLAVPRTTANGLITCRQIQDFPLSLNFTSNLVSPRKFRFRPPTSHNVLHYSERLTL